MGPSSIKARGILRITHHSHRPLLEFKYHGQLPLSFIEREIITKDNPRLAFVLAFVLGMASSEFHVHARCRQRRRLAPVLSRDSE